MAIKAGELVSFGAVFAEADFDLDKEASVEYGDGVDRRRVKVGGLGFNETDETFRIPVGVTALEVTLDGEVVATVEVEEASDAAKATATVHEKDSNDTEV